MRYAPGKQRIQKRQLRRAADGLLNHSEQLQLLLRVVVLALADLAVDHASQRRHVALIQLGRLTIRLGRCSVLTQQTLLVAAQVSRETAEREGNWYCDHDRLACAKAASSKRDHAWVGTEGSHVCGLCETEA
jgi:hypothetical protein